MTATPIVVLDAYDMLASPGKLPRMQFNEGQSRRKHPAIALYVSLQFHHCIGRLLSSHTTAMAFKTDVTLNLALARSTLGAKAMALMSNLPSPSYKSLAACFWGVAISFYLIWLVGGLKRKRPILPQHHLV